MSLPRTFFLSVPVCLPPSRESNFALSMKQAPDLKGKNIQAKIRSKTNKTKRLEIGPFAPNQTSNPNRDALVNSPSLCYSQIFPLYETQRFK